MFVRRLKYMNIPIIFIVCFTILPPLLNECRAENCKLPEGVLDIAIIGNNSKNAKWKDRTLEISNQDIVKKLSTNVYQGSGDESSKALPRHLIDKSLRLDIPYEISHTNSLLAATVYPDNIAIVQSKQIVIVDLNSDKIIDRINFEKYVLSLSWSPTGNYLSVLLRENVTKKTIPGPFDLLGKLLGHPVSYNNISIAIYDKSGQFVCERNIVEKLRMGWGFIINWTQ